jgi:tyrosyl-tRNA synthetase
LFTELPILEIEKLEALKGAEINEAKKILANEATTMIHGEQAARDAAETARKTFEEGTQGDALPIIEVPREAIAAGVPVFALFRDAGLATSNGEARRLIKGGGAKLNDEKVEAEDVIITLEDFAANDTIKLSAGKKRHALVKVL